MKRRESMPLRMTVIALLTVSPAVWAGCDERSAQCLVVEQGEVREQSCHVAVCANTQQYTLDLTLEHGGQVSVRSDDQSHRILIDQQPGIAIAPAILKPGLTCYAATQATTAYCVKDLLL